jgi:hypothetical protein
MHPHLRDFLESFLSKRYQKGRLDSLAKPKKGNPLRGMDALYRELDERYCTPLPSGNQPREIAFVQQALAKYKLTTCYVLSAYEPFNEQLMPIEEALQKIVGSSSTTIICFLPTVAYFEGHSVGERYLCIRDVR